ncbi:MAG TPA: hypothetical protein VIV11_21655, partial [Kofleriaceae bacterium]
MGVEPYTDVATHVRDELRRVWLRLEYQIRLGWRKETNVAGEEIVGPEDMGRLFSLARGAALPDKDSGAEPVLEQWLAAHEHTEARIKATIEARVRSPLVDVIRTFNLSQRQWSTLVFALMPEVDPNLVQGYRYLARDATVRGLDGRLLAQLVYDTPQTRSLMARDLSASSPLLRYRLLDLAGGAAPSDSLMFRRIRAATRLVYILDGGTLELDPEVAEIAELRWGPVSGAFPAVTVDRATSALRSNDVVLAVQGQRGLGKKLLLQLATAHWNQRLLLVDSKRLAQLQLAAQQTMVRSVVRELMLLDALPAFIDVDDANVVDSDRDAMPAFFDMFLDEWTGPVALTINRERMPRIHQR